LPLAEELLVLLVADELEEPPVIERIAKSTFPEVGLMMISLIVPMLSPEDEVTDALVSWLPLTSCCPILPVALKRPLELLLPLKPEPEEEPELPP